MEVAEKKRKITNSYTCYNSFSEILIGSYLPLRRSVFLGAMFIMK